MEYTAIQPDAVVDDLLIQKVDQADQLSLAYRLDNGSCDFCEQIREIAGDPPDPALTEQKTKTEALATAEAEKVTTISEKITNVPEDLSTKLASARQQWLKTFIAQIEAEHAQHQGLIDNADVLDVDAEQIEKSLIAQLVIEGAHGSALSELNALGG